jgi:hypothetical protein
LGEKIFSSFEFNPLFLTRYIEKAGTGRLNMVLGTGSVTIWEGAHPVTENNGINGATSRCLPRQSNGINEATSRCLFLFDQAVKGEIFPPQANLALSPNLQSKITLMAKDYWLKVSKRARPMASNTYETAGFGILYPKTPPVFLPELSLIKSFCKKFITSLINRKNYRFFEAGSSSRNTP